MTTLLGRTVTRALDLAFPAVCPGCAREGAPICDGCAPALDARLQAPPGTPIGLWGDLPPPLLQLEWAAPFAGVVRDALHALKYAGEQRIAVPLGAAMARRWSVAGDGGEVLVPVPVHELRRRERGYDQAELLARRVAGELGLPMTPCLVRVRATEAQFRLGRGERAGNVASAFSATSDAELIRGRWVVLVDDVVTTGSTLAACGRTLLRAGAMAVSALAMARER
jgi:ComF family protein